MSRVWEDSQQQKTNLLMLLAIADNANDDGYAFPGVAYLAQKTRMSRRSAGLRVRHLAACGELHVYPRAGKSHEFLFTLGFEPEHIAMMAGGIADQRGVDPIHLERVRRIFAGLTRWKVRRIFAGGAKNLRRGCEVFDRGPANLDSHEPSLRTVINQENDISISPVFNECWKKALSELQLQLPKETFDTWLRSASLLSSDGQTYVVGVHNIHAREWLEQRLSKVITRTLTRIAGEAVGVEFEVKA